MAQKAQLAAKRLWTSVGNPRPLKGFYRSHLQHLVDSGESNKLDGKYFGKAARKRGYLPGRIFGRPERALPEESIPIVTDEQELNKNWRWRGLSFECTLFQMDFEDGRSELVFPKETQIDPLRRDFLVSCNFFRYNPEIGARVLMPVDVVGKDRCIGLKQSAATYVNLINPILDVYVYGDEIPHALVIDIENLDVTDKVFYKDLNAPDNIKLNMKPTKFFEDLLILNIKGSRVDENRVKRERKEKKMKEMQQQLDQEQEQEERGVFG